jgi:general secretion pathway protein D
MNHTKLPTKLLVLLAAPVLLTLAIPVVKAQSQTETKIRLMAEALRARDSGDLATAKTNLEQLLVLAPTDVTVQRLLSGVNDALAKGVTAAELTPALPAPSTPTDAVYNPDAMVQANPAQPAAPAPSPAAAAPEAVATVSVADEMVAAEADRVKDLISAAKAEKKAALSLARNGDYDAATAKLDAASRTLPVNTLTQDTLTSLDETKNELMLRKSRELLKKGDTVGAKVALDGYKVSPSASASAVKKQAGRIDRVELDPSIKPIEEANPAFLVEQKKIAALVIKGRSQYVAGDVDGAQETFSTVETESADNPEAKYFLQRIAEEKAKVGTLNRDKTRSLLLQEVANAWQRPGVYIEKERESTTANRSDSAALAAKLESILIPSVSFSGVELGRVISTLSAFSEEFDPSNSGTKGVNLVLTNQLPGATVPQVNITLRNLSLKRILDIITQNVGYQYEIQSDLILVRPSGDNVNLTTEEFPVSKSALTRMTGVGASGTASSSASTDPFAPAASASSGGASSGGEADALKRFLSAAGVNFEGVSGSNLAYDGTRIIVTQTGRNIERIRNILGRYNDIRQVEIEAKFMDVLEGAVDELGVSWTALQNGSSTGLAVGSQTRGLSNSFSGSNSGNGGQIVTIPRTAVDTNNGGVLDTFIPGDPVITNIPNAAPSIPGGLNLGGAMGAVAAVTGARVGNFDVTATLRALSLRQGSDLLSAPKVTVLSGSPASITVAQELRYPQSYGETQSEVGQQSGASSTGSGGGGGVTITAGTPQDFTTRNVGVELTVTPTVEEDEYSISLELNPRVTEFEGFVEYGGQSVAISGDTTVTVPSGFYQPIFSSREIKTRVTVWDGATLVMGGLTREEVKRVNDKTPFLGDIPYLGRLFKSKGEASTKRNLLIFVTANLVSPGGSLKKQELKGVSPNSVFQNPSVVTPGNSENRIRSN